MNANHVYILTTEATECYILSKLKEHLTSECVFLASRNRAQLLVYLNIIYVDYMWKYKMLHVHVLDNSDAKVLIICAHGYAY